MGENARTGGEIREGKESSLIFIRPFSAEDN